MERNICGEVELITEEEMYRAVSGIAAMAEHDANVARLRG